MTATPTKNKSGEILYVKVTPACGHTTYITVTRDGSDHEALVELILSKRTGTCPTCHADFTGPSASYVEKAEYEADKGLS